MIRIAAGGEPQQQLVGVEPREQALAFEHEAHTVGLDVREAAEIAAPDPRQFQRRERLKERALTRRRAARATRDETHAAVRSGHALE